MVDVVRNLFKCGSTNPRRYHIDHTDHIFDHMKRGNPYIPSVVGLPHADHINVVDHISTTRQPHRDHMGDHTQPHQNCHTYPNYENTC